MSTSESCSSLDDSDYKSESDSNILDYVDMTQDSVGKEIYAICRSLSMNLLEYEEFKSKYEAKIKEKYPLFEQHCAAYQQALPLSYAKYEDYYAYWKPFFLLQAFSSMKDEQFSEPENMVSIVKAVKNYHRDKAVIFRCTISKHIIEMMYFSHCIVSLTKNRLENKDCFPHKRYGRTLKVVNIRNLLEEDAECDPITFDLFDFGDITVLMPKEEDAEAIQVGDSFYMNIISPHFCQTRQEKNLRRFESNQFYKDHFLSPKINKPNLFPQGFSGAIDNYLNIYQNLAVQTVLKHLKQNKNGEIVQVIGPPGSGKTTTIISILKEVFRHNFKARVLVCTPSNAAVNLIARRVVDNRLIFDEPNAFLEPGPIFRLGVLDKIDEELKYFNPRSKANYLRLTKPRTLVFSTLNSCQPYSMDSYISKISYDLVICDEACQCTEPELSMAFAFKSTLFVLVGDHKQLQPTIKSQLCVELGYGRSFFERMQTLKDSVNDTTTIGLWYQYRMKPEICDFPSNQFYFGALQTAMYIGTNFNIYMPPMTCFNVMDTEEDRFNTSVRNVKEGNFVINLLNDILQKGITIGSPISIGVICFYKAQSDYIDSCIQQEPFYANFNIQVDTVDAFQGREKDITIISCSRSNQRKAIGFSESRSRLNVALTRSKTALIIVVDQSTFQQEPLWQELFFHYSDRNRLFSVKSATVCFDKYLHCFPGFPSY